MDDVTSAMLEDRSARLEELRGKARKAVREAYQFNPGSYTHTAMRVVLQLVSELDNFHIKPKLGRKPA